MQPSAFSQKPEVRNRTASLSECVGCPVRERACERSAELLAV